jgi:hypothetical protein
MPFAVPPETLENGERVSLIKPDCPSEVFAIIAVVYDAELTSASSEDILIFVSRFEARSTFHRAPDIVDDFVRDFEIESEDDDFGMPIGMKQAGGISPLGPFFTVTLEDLRYGPTVSFNVGEELLISRMEVLKFVNVSSHALQNSTRPG